MSLRINRTYLKLQANCRISKCRELIDVANLNGDNHREAVIHIKTAKEFGGVRTTDNPLHVVVYVLFMGRTCVWCVARVGMIYSSVRVTVLVTVRWRKHVRYFAYCAYL